MSRSPDDVAKRMSEVMPKETGEQFLEKFKKHWKEDGGAYKAPECQTNNWNYLGVMLKETCGAEDTEWKKDAVAIFMNKK